MKLVKIGGFKPAVFNAANETAVYAFLDGKSYLAISIKSLPLFWNPWEEKMILLSITY